MLLDHIERLRSQNPETRRRYALLYSGVATGGIVLVWLSVLYFGRSAYLGEVAEEPAVDTTEQESFIRGDFSDITNEFLNTSSVQNTSRGERNRTAPGEAGAFSEGTGVVPPATLPEVVLPTGPEAGLPPSDTGALPGTASSAEAVFTEDLLREVQ